MPEAEKSLLVDARRDRRAEEFGGEGEAIPRGIDEDRRLAGEE